MRLLPHKTYLEPELSREVARLARAQGRSESAVIADCVRTRIATGSVSVAAAAQDTGKRQLNRIEANTKWLIANQKITLESLFLFVRVWLEHNPKLEDEIADSAAMSAQARFERFLDLAQRVVAQGGTDLTAIAAPLPEPQETAA